MREDQETGVAALEARPADRRDARGRAGVLAQRSPVAPPCPCEPGPAPIVAVASPRRARRAGLAGGALAGLLALAHTVNDALTALPTVLLPSLQERFGLSETALAAIVALMWGSSSITQPLFGAVADRVGRRGLAAGGVVTSSVLFSLIGVLPAAWLVFAVVLVAGLGSTALHPVGSSLARGDGGRRSELALSLFSAGGMVGFAVGPVVVLAVVGTLGLGGTPWLMIPGVLLGAVLWVVVPPDRPVDDGHRHRLVDVGLLRGPIGALVVAGLLADLAFVTFLSAMPLWLVGEQGVAADAPLVGWTLAAFALAAGAGAVVAGVLASRVPRRVLVATSMTLAAVPLLLVLHLPAGSAGSFAMIALAGALVYANFPLMILSAQDLAPDAVATASGMLMGLATGVAGLLYIGVGALQELVGLAAAMRIAYAGLVPAALLAFAVLSRHRRVVGG